MHKVKILACLAIVLGMTGCGGVVKSLSQDWQNAINPQAPRPTPQPAIYCYSSLGQVTCYDKPQSGAMVGTTEQPPTPPVDEHKILQGDTTLPITPVIDTTTAPTLPVPDPAAATMSVKPIDDAPAATQPPSEPEPVLPPSVVRVDPVVALPPVAVPLPHAMVPATGMTEPAANKPLSDPYLRELNQLPISSISGDKPITVPVAPIVEPKTKSKGKTKKPTPPKAP